MSISTIHPRRMMARVVGSGAWVVLMLMLFGCNTNYGRFARSAEVDLAFRQGDHQPGYQYYYAGRDTMPYAIIGIDRSYTVPSQYWLAFEPQAEQLVKMSGNMYGQGHDYPSGSHILDPDGTIIGVWFSSVRLPSVKVDQQRKTVEVLFANPENRRHS